MSILDKVTRLEKRLQQLSRRDDVALEPIEVRSAFLDEIEDMVQPAGRSRRVFPYDRLTLHVVAPDAAARAATMAVLGGGEELLRAVRERLREAGCPAPEGLAVRLRVQKKPGSGWPPGRTWHVAGERTAAGGAAAPQVQAPGAAGRAGPSESPRVGLAHLTVVKGSATRKTYQLTGGRVNVGRFAEVMDRDRRVIRRNQVVFDESDDPVNQTVSRAHAHIRVSASGECRLFDDRSSYGTRIFRGGQTISIPPTSQRGAKLKDGDEIYFGQACVRVVAKPRASEPRSGA